MALLGSGRIAAAPARRHRPLYPGRHRQTPQPFPVSRAPGREHDPRAAPWKAATDIVPATIVPRHRGRPGRGARRPAGPGRAGGRAGRRRLGLPGLERPGRPPRDRRGTGGLPGAAVVPRRRGGRRLPTGGPGRHRASAGAPRPPARGVRRSSVGPPPGWSSTISPTSSARTPRSCPSWPPGSVARRRLELGRRFRQVGQVAPLRLPPAGPGCRRGGPWWTARRHCRSGCATWRRPRAWPADDQRIRPGPAPRDEPPVPAPGGSGRPFRSRARHRPPSVRIGGRCGRECGGPATLPGPGPGQTRVPTRGGTRRCAERSPGRPPSGVRTWSSSSRGLPPKTGMQPADLARHAGRAQTGPQLGQGDGSRLVDVADAADVEHHVRGSRPGRAGRAGCPRPPTRTRRGTRPHATSSARPWGTSVRSSRATGTATPGSGAGGGTEAR